MTTAEIDGRNVAGRSDKQHPVIYSDTELLDALRHHSWELRPINVATGGDDCSTYWMVIEAGEPEENCLGRAYCDEPRQAIEAALVGRSIGWSLLSQTSAEGR